MIAGKYIRIFHLKNKTYLMYIIILPTLLIVLFFLIFNILFYLRFTPEYALNAFYKRNCMENEQIDPLVVSGMKAAPLVLKEITDSKMPKRRYAIDFLGQVRYKPAIPILNNILMNPSEPDYIRCEAKKAIYQTIHGYCRDVDYRRRKFVDAYINCFYEYLLEED